MRAGIRRGFGLATVVIITFLAVSLGVQAADFTPKRQYRLSVVIGPNYAWGQGAARFADLVREKTDGKINIKVYYGGQLFKGEQTSELQLMAQGAIDFAWASTINWSPVVPELNLFSLPFFLRDYERLDKLLESDVADYLFKKVAEKGVTPLAWAEDGFRQVTNSKHPIATPEDLEDLKIRVVGSPIFIDIYRQLGADPVSMNWGDAVTAFNQGVVDGQENPPGVLVPVTIWEYQKYATFWNYLADPLIVGVSTRLWEQFPPDIQEAIQEAAEEAAHWEKAMARRGLDDGTALKILQEEYATELEFTDYREYLRSKGMEVIVLDEDQQQAFRDQLQPVYDKWVPRIGSDLVEDAQAVMAE